MEESSVIATNLVNKLPQKFSLWEKICSMSKATKFLAILIVVAAIPLTVAMSQFQLQTKQQAATVGNAIIDSSVVANQPFTLAQCRDGVPLVPAPIVDDQPYLCELTQSQINDVHAENSNNKVIRYVDTIEAINTVANLTDKQTWSLGYAKRLNTDDEWNDIWTNHKDWFLKDSSGNYINRPSSYPNEFNPQRAYLMDPGNAGWRDFLVNKIGQRLAYGYDGVFLDGCYTTPNGHSAMPAKYANNYGLWRKDINDLINYLKSKYPNATIITNSAWQGRDYYANSSTNPIDSNNEDGTEVEGFIFANGDGPTESQANWLQEVQFIKKLGDEGKTVLARAGLSATNSTSAKKLLAYSLSTFLLGKSTNSSYFNFVTNKIETGYSDDYKNSVYNLPLGSSSGLYYQSGISFQRDFANGKSIVNPNDSSQAYIFYPTFSQYYKDQDGNIVDPAHPVSIAAKAGIILITDPAPSPVIIPTSPSQIKLNSTGSSVSILQETLNVLGYGPIIVNGSFNSTTDTDIRKFQKAKGLSADGVVGPNTWGFLKTSLASYYVAHPIPVSTPTLTPIFTPVPTITSIPNATLTPTLTQVSTKIRYEQTNAGIVKSGTWATFSKTLASGGSYGRSSTVGASATVTFTGTRLEVISMYGTTTGIDDFYLDGVKVKTLDTGATTATYQQVLYDTGDIAQGTHTVKIVRDNNSVSGKYLTLDAVDIWGTIASTPN